MKKVIDLAKWNPVRNYEMVKADGIDHAILKAVNMNLNKDSLFETHVKGCNGAGIDLLATYHYVYGSMNYKIAAQRWIDAVNGRCKKYCLDWEDASLPKDRRAVDAIHTYAEAIVNAGGELYVYCGYSWYKSYLKKYAAELLYPFWIARYPSNIIMDDEQDPDNKYKPSIVHDMAGWQYTSKGRVDGIDGNVDLSVWYQDLGESCKKTEMIPIEHNPYFETSGTLTVGSFGEGVKWMQWYLYRFGLLLDDAGRPDSSKIDGIFGADTLAALITAQHILGLTEDGKCGKITKATFKKIC